MTLALPLDHVRQYSTWWKHVLSHIWKVPSTVFNVQEWKFNLLDGSWFIYALFTTDCYLATYEMIRWGAEILFKWSELILNQYSCIRLEKLRNIKAPFVMAFDILTSQRRPFYKTPGLIARGHLNEWWHLSHPLTFWTRHKIRASFSYKFT